MIGHREGIRHSRRSWLPPILHTAKSGGSMGGKICCVPKGLKKRFPKPGLREKYPLDENTAAVIAAGAPALSRSHSQKRFACPVSDQPGNILQWGMPFSWCADPFDENGQRKTIWKVLPSGVSVHCNRYHPSGLLIGTMALYFANTIAASESPSNSSAGSSVSLSDVALLFIISSTATSSI